MKRSSRVVAIVVIGAIFLVFSAFSVLGGAALLTEYIGIAAAFVAVLAFAAIATYFAIDLTLLKRLRRFGSDLDLRNSNNVDLRLRLPVASGHELGRFSRSFNILLAKIHNFVFQMKNIASRGIQIGTVLAASAEKVASSVEESARMVESIGGNGIRLNEVALSASGSVSEIRGLIEGIVGSIASQNDSIGRSSAAVEQLIASISSLNKVARTRTTLVQSIKEQTKASEESMTESLEAMRRVNKSAGSIGEFMEVISSVASQTNLLALNAAIEAAHTGDAGRGVQALAKAFGLRATVRVGTYDLKVERELIADAIREKPDLIIACPAESESSLGWIKSIYEEGIPIVLSLAQPTKEGYAYIVGFTGFDDWGSHRLLARDFAKRLGNKGGYGVVGHKSGSSQFFARTWGFQTELKKVAPAMTCLGSASTELDRKRTKDLVESWLREYGSRLSAIFVADSFNPLLGAVDAIDAAGRKDIVVYATGNNRVSLDLMKAGKVHGIRWESAEADGALALETAVDYFNGLAVMPIRYLPMKVIRPEDVDSYYPPQW